MVDLSQATPFVGIVNSDRQKTKAPRGTRIEVRTIKEGKFGVYALCFAMGDDAPMSMLADDVPLFLKPSNIDYVSDVSDERGKEIEGEKAAWLAERNTPVVIGSGELQPSGKSVMVWVAVEAATHSANGNGREPLASECRTFFPLSTVTESDGEYSAPPWLAKVKAADAAYYWLSGGGRRGVDHLGGDRDGITVQYSSGLSYAILWDDLQDARGRSNR